MVGTSAMPLFLTGVGDTPPTLSYYGVLYHFDSSLSLYNTSSSAYLSLMPNKKTFSSIVLHCVSRLLLF